MGWELSIRKVFAGIAALLTVLFAIGWMTRQDITDDSYLQFLGGGFMFNYREGEVFYGFTAEVVRPLANGSIIEARFEDPRGGPPHVVTERVSTMTNRYSLRSPPVRGVEADKPYHVAIRIYDREGKELIWQTERDYTSQISDSVVPEKPLTIGPGYHRNPEAMSFKSP